MSENSASSAVAVEPESVSLQPAPVEPISASGDLGAFLGTLATVLRETIGRFEQTTDRVSEMVIKHTGRAGPDLIHAIQDFDRLQQELGAVGDVLSRLEISTTGHWPGNPTIAALKADLLDCVKLSDVKERLSMHFDALDPDAPANPPPEEMVAEF